MGVHLLVFLGVGALVILIPGPDTAVVTKNAILHSRRVGLGTSLGVNAGLLVWTVATAVGVASLVRASAVAFTVLKVAGAIYLIWLGIQALRAARHAAEDDAAPSASRRRRLSTRDGFRQGFISNIANPKVGVFFTSLLPQFVTPGKPVLLPFLLLGTLFIAMNILWLSGYALAASRAARTLQKPKVKAALDRVTGVILIAVGLRLATEHR